MFLRRSLDRKILRRLLLALLLSGLLSVLGSAWIFQIANEQSANTQLASAHDHYTNVIASLEQRWGREAFNVKIRLESQHFLEDPTQKKEKLLTNLTAQGGSLEFPSLRIEDARGELIAAFEYVGQKPPKVRFLPGQDSTWVMDPVQNRLYMVFRQLIWLGTENGYLLLFKPMDNALLTQHSYPFTRLSLWWKGKAIASSDGDDGLAMATTAFKKLDNKLSPAQLAWSSQEPDNAPLLFIESTSPPLLTVGELAVPLGFSFIAFMLAAWATLGAVKIRKPKVQADDIS